jgi:hypothetical protein
MAKHEHKGMIDNKRVSCNHQQGIKRVEGVGKTMSPGQGGKMSQHKEGKHFERKGPKEVPKRA